MRTTKAFDCRHREEVWFVGNQATERHGSILRAEVAPNNKSQCEFSVRAEGEQNG
jgi:hypothetical protein